MRYEGQEDQGGGKPPPWQMLDIGNLRKMLYTVPQSEVTDGRATVRVAFYSLSFKIKRIVQEEARLSG
jgi:hypothetical protein